jgi:ABC-type sugar transport system substrate-binding protein
MQTVIRALGSMTFSAMVLSTAMAGPAEAKDKLKIGMAVGGNPCCEWQKAQGEVARALAKQRGWDYVELSNNNDPSTAVKNAQIFAQEGVDVVIQFNGQPSANPVMMQTYSAAKIPVITYDIAAKGMYFVGVDNKAAGISGGEQFGKIIKERWDCKPDLVISAEGRNAGIVNEWRTGGMRTGLKNICPDIPDSKFKSYDSNSDASIGVPAARDLIAANPTAKKMAVIGINDAGVLAAIQGAEQLGRGDEIIAWGQDGAFITGKNVNPKLLGSVFYFLESYAVHAFRDVIDPIAAGNVPEVKSVPDDPASRVRPCPVTAEQAKSVPDMPQRVAKLLEAPKGTTAYDLFCPSK